MKDTITFICVVIFVSAFGFGLGVVLGKIAQFIGVI